jgi:hypothetical protein
MRQALGLAVFSGMLGVTFFGIFLTPVFFYTLRRFGRHVKAAAIGVGHVPLVPPQFPLGPPVSHHDGPQGDTQIRHEREQ